MNGLGILATLGLWIAYSSIIRGVALTFLWSWFIASKFNLPDLTILEAIGLIVTVSFFRSAESDKRDDETPEQIMWRGFKYVTAQVVLALGTGYVVHLFI